MEKIKDPFFGVYIPEREDVRIPPHLWLATEKIGAPLEISKQNPESKLATDPTQLGPEIRKKQKNKPL